MYVTWVMLAVQLYIETWDIISVYLQTNNSICDRVQCHVLCHGRWQGLQTVVIQYPAFRTRKIPQACKCKNRKISFKHKTVVASSHCSTWRVFTRQYSAWIRHATLSCLLCTIFIRNSLHLLEHRVVCSDLFPNKKRSLFRSVMSRYWNIFYRVINFKK